MLLDNNLYRKITRSGETVGMENDHSITASVFALFRSERDCIHAYGHDYTEVLINKSVAARSIRECFSPPMLNLGMIQAPFRFFENSNRRCELDFFMPSIDHLDEVACAFLAFLDIDEDDNPWQDDDGVIDTTGFHRFLPLLHTETGPAIFFPENLYQLIEYLAEDRGRARLANLFSRTPTELLAPPQPA